MRFFSLVEHLNMFSQSIMFQKAGYEISLSFPLWRRILRLICSNSCKLTFKDALPQGECWREFGSLNNHCGGEMAELDSLVSSLLGVGLLLQNQLFTRGRPA